MESRRRNSSSTSSENESFPSALNETDNTSHSEKRRKKSFLWNPNISYSSRRTWRPKKRKPTLVASAVDEFESTTSVVASPDFPPEDDNGVLVHTSEYAESVNNEGSYQESTLEDLDLSLDESDDEWSYAGYLRTDNDETTWQESDEDDQDILPQREYEAELSNDTSATDSVHPEFKRPLWNIPPSEHSTVSQITRMDSFMATMAWAIGTCASNQQFNSVIQLLKLHMPDVNEGANSVDYLKKVFTQTKGDEFEVVEHDYCHKCRRLFQEEEEECVTASCNGKRFSDQGKKVKRAYFYALNIKAQVASLLKRDNVWAQIKKYKEKIATRRANGDSLLTDITDGAEYVKLCQEEGFLSHPSNISFLVNTDGVPVFKSTKFSIWPLYLAINELPPHLRFLKKNLLLWGVWFGSEKPLMKTYLSPFVQDIKALQEDGVSITFKTETVTIKALFLAYTVDLQAKSMILEFIAHNGYYSCSYCDDPGHAPKNQKGRRQHAFAYSSNGNLRTNEQWKMDAVEAVETKRMEKGIKSMCILAEADWFDIVVGFVIDYMHGALIGITSALLDKWFAPKNYKEEYFIGHKVEDVDRRLMAMRPPDFISRLPRKIETTRKYWKASEMRNWLLYYGLPCTDGILPEKYFKNFSYLVTGIYLLLKERISRQDIIVADYCLRNFYLHAELYYGGTFCGLNVHHLKHVSKCVENWGPLWAYSCFPFESQNGDLLKLFHGTRNPVEQILYMVCMSRQVVSNTPLLQPGTHVQGFVEKMLGTRKRVETGQKLISGQSWSIVGKRIAANSCSASIFNAVKEIMPRVLLSNLEKVTRMTCFGEVFYSADYGKLKTCGYCVEYGNDGLFGLVQYFLYSPSLGNAVAVIHPLKQLDSVFQTLWLDNNCSHHIQEVVQDNSVKVIPVTSIVRKAALLEGQEKKLYKLFLSETGGHEERIKEPNQEI